MRTVYAFITQGFRQESAYKVEGRMGMIASLIWFVLYAGIWTALLRGDPAALQRQMAYIVATRVLSELNFPPTWEVGAKFRQGDVGLELVKPVALPVRVLADFLGRSGFHLVRSLPIYVVIWAVFRLPVPPVGSLLLFVISGLLGWVITATLQLSLTLIALWTVQFESAEQLFETAGNLFSGAFIPLYYLPVWVQSFVKYLPFAGVFFVPAALLSGSLTGAALAQALGLQVVWALIGIGTVSAMWAAGSRKLVVQGG